MLTFSCARAAFASRSAADAGAALTLSVATLILFLIIFLIMAWTPAHAGGSLTGGCLGSWSSATCALQWGPPIDPFIRTVPQPVDRVEQARAIGRDRKWMARCRPFVMQDRYGVARYHYSAPGCEFGVGEFD